MESIALLYSRARGLQAALFHLGASSRSGTSETGKESRHSDDGVITNFDR